MVSGCRQRWAGTRVCSHCTRSDAAKSCKAWTVLGVTTTWPVASTSLRHGERLAAVCLVWLQETELRTLKAAADDVASKFDAAVAALAAKRLDVLAEVGSSTIQ